MTGYVDLHCHGGGGHAFDEIADSGGAEAFAKAVATQLAGGTEKLMISLVTAPIDVLAERAALVAGQCKANDSLLGIHLEGPFLASSKCGAHDPELLRAPDRYAVQTLIDACQGQLRQVTIAPELDGAMQAIAQFREADVLVAVGHTEADYKQSLAAFDAGASLLTHAFNGMNGLAHRAPGPIAAALDREHVTLELIADGYHVHPRMIRLLFANAAGRVALITDAMAAAGMPDGEYKLGALDVTVVNSLPRIRGEDGVLGSIAGSTLTMNKAVAVALAAGVDAQTVQAAATAVPLKALGFAGENLAS